MSSMIISMGILTAPLPMLWVAIQMAMKPPKSLRELSM